MCGWTSEHSGVSSGYSEHRDSRDPYHDLSTRLHRRKGNLQDTCIQADSAHRSKNSGKTG